MRRYEEDKERIAKAKNEFPETFTMLGNQDKTFRISLAYSYINDANEIQLYTEVLSSEGEWLSYAKGSPSELKHYIVKL